MARGNGELTTATYNEQSRGSRHESLLVPFRRDPMGSCWACSACTLVNKDDALCCECCGFVKQPPEGTSEQQQQGRDVVCIDDDGDTDAEAGEQTPAPSTQYDQAQLGSQQGLYVLDCGCHCMLVTLPNRLINQAQQHVLKPQVALQHAVQNLTCPQCGKLVSNADAYKVCGGLTPGNADKCTLVAQSPHPHAPHPFTAQHKLSFRVLLALACLFLCFSCWAPPA